MVPEYNGPLCGSHLRNRPMNIGIYMIVPESLCNQYMISLSFPHLLPSLYHLFQPNICLAYRVQILMQQYLLGAGFAMHY